MAMRQLRVLPSIVERQTYRGGWPLGFISATCPADTPVKCQSNPAYNLNCCPSGQFCFGTLQPYCCPSDDDCGPAVKNVPVCANSTWNMYRNEEWSNNNYFCCPPGYIGVLPQRGSSGICEIEGVNIPKSQLATVASQIGGTSVTASGRVPTATAGSGSSVTATSGRVSGTSTVTPTSVPGDGSGPGPGPETSSTPPLSTGAIAGIAVGGAAVFLILFALILWLHRRSLRKRPPPAFSNTPDEPFIQEYSTTAGETETKQTGFTQPNTPSPGYEYPAPHNTSQLDAASRVEMEAPAGGWAYNAGGRQGN